MTLWQRFIRWLAPQGPYECAFCLDWKDAMCFAPWPDGVCHECRRVLRLERTR